ncbi:MAG TPA: acylphosphatase [Xanthobacteraceae bacterium]|nr:acylphosphatase [Xanthobacteraceae bacterium]
MRFVRLMIHGRVHGVGFRAFVEHEATERGLEGWVRNRRDGSVEAVVAGDDAGIDGMIAACKRGPAVARVDRIDVDEADANELARREPGERFSVLQTV